jgi:hypothetical protein
MRCRYMAAASDKSRSARLDASQAVPSLARVTGLCSFGWNGWIKGWNQQRVAGFKRIRAVIYGDNPFGGQVVRLSYSS